MKILITTTTTNSNGTKKPGIGSKLPKEPGQGQALEEFLRYSEPVT